MKTKKIIIVLTLAALTSIVLGAITVNAIPSEHPHFGTLGTVYVTSQGLYYDTFVPVDALPWTGYNGNSFQRLYDGMTDFGPGDPGYKGGRWWVDVNGNNEMDPEGIDHYVLCPLFGPGRESP